MKKKIVVLPGDGIGPEVTEQAIKVLKAVATICDHSFQFTEKLIGATAIEKTGTPLPEETLKACLAADAVLLGAIGHPKYDNDPTAKVRPEQGLLKLRQSLQLYANIRPIKTYPVLYGASPLKEKLLKGTDILMFRELTGGIYFGNKERHNGGKEATDTCTYTYEEIERIAHLAFKAALKRKKKLTLVDKANVLETSRLWRETVKNIAAGYPEVDFDYMYVDSASMKLITQPGSFDVILTENMFGDILSDEASVITGSIGLLPSASIGIKTSVFEPIHGSYPQAAGLGTANPLGAILSAAMMLNTAFNMVFEASLIEKAIEETLKRKHVTSDIQTDSVPFSTSEVGDAVVEWIYSRVPCDL